MRQTGHSYRSFHSGTGRRNKICSPPLFPGAHTPIRHTPVSKSPMHRCVRYGYRPYVLFVPRSSVSYFSSTSVTSAFGNPFSFLLYPGARKQWRHTGTQLRFLRSSTQLSGLIHRYEILRTATASSYSVILSFSVPFWSCSVYDKFGLCHLRNWWTISHG